MGLGGGKSHFIESACCLPKGTWILHGEDSQKERMAPFEESTPFYRVRLLVFIWMQLLTDRSVRL